MLLLLSYLFIFCVGFGFFKLFNYFKKKYPNNEKVEKAASLILGIVAYCCYQVRNPVLEHTYGLNISSPFGDKIWMTTVGTLLVWFTYASTLLIVLYPFFKQIKNIKNLIKFFAVPVYILDIGFLLIYGISISGVYAFEMDKWHYLSTNKDVYIIAFKWLFLTLQLGVGIGYLFNQFILDGKNKLNKEYFKISKDELKVMAITIIPVLLAILPGFVVQVFFGEPGNTEIKFKGLTQAHRIVLYGAFVTPTIIFHCFKDKSKDIKKFAMIYLSLSVLWTFMSHYNFEDLLDPLCWPFHLCNTAMFIVPLCLIFDLKKLFYFTFFINVFGAFMAMLMPNTSDGNVFQMGTVTFFIDHYHAFYMPVLIVALGLFERPKFKQWKYSMVAFGVYFLAMIILNAWFTNYGDVDYFFLNSDFIASKLGEGGKALRDQTFIIFVGWRIFRFYPLYHSLFFIVYCILSLAMWFVYEQLFRMWDNNTLRRQKQKDYKRLQEELKTLLEGRNEDENMSGNNKACLELKEFSKKYGVNNYYSVYKASLKIEGGEIFGFLGPNGAGKSTIIKSIVGIQTITDGHIEVCGYDVEKQPVQAKKEIGFVPDHYALYENLTGREYINYIADLYGVSQEDRDARISKYVANFQLETAFDNQMKTYSHGMKQKITIMAALVHNPKVWILDEPLTGLDPNSIFQVKECMKEHAKEGNIVFFSSHIIDVVERICDKIAIIKKGHIETCVSLKELEKKKINLEDFYLETIGGDCEGK